MEPEGIPSSPEFQSVVPVFPAGPLPVPVRSGVRPRRLARSVHRLFQVFGIAVLVVTGVVASLVGLSWVRSEGAVAVVQAQMDAIRTGRMEQAYSLFSDSYQAGVTLPMFRRWVRREGHLDRVQKLQFWGRSVWGGTTVLWGSFQDDLGHSYPVRYLLIRENGSWRIDGFQLSADSPDPAPATTRFIQI